MDVVQHQPGGISGMDSVGQTCQRKSEKDYYSGFDKKSKKFEGIIHRQECEMNLP